MKRRQKGEGSLFYSKKQSRWVAQITLPDGRKRSRFSKNQGEVKKWLLDQRKSISDGLYLKKDLQTVETFLNRYIEDVSGSLSTRTVLSYKYLIRKHIVPEIGSIKLASLTPQNLQTLYSKKLSEGKSRRTVQYIHHFLHTALANAYKWELVMRNVADLVTPPTQEKKVPVILTTSQINTLLEKVKGTREYPLYACAASLGLREGEILALEWDDINFDSRTISINKQVQYIPGQGISVAPPKTKGSIRVLPLPEIAFNALKEHREGSNSSLVFATRSGTHFYPRNVLRDFQDNLQRFGLPKIPFHNLRHSCASYHLAMGTNPRVVQAILGHSSVTITLQTYSHLLPGVTEEAAKNINKIFS